MASSKASTLLLLVVSWLLWHVGTAARDDFGRRRGFGYPEQDVAGALSCRSLLLRLGSWRARLGYTACWLSASRRWWWWPIW
jgi:hypothetical protein